MIEIISGPAEAALWLAVLTPGALGGCMVCRGSSVWHHPVHGPLHPRCVARAMTVLDDGAKESTVSTAPTRHRGAYSRRGFV